MAFPSDIHNNQWADPNNLQKWNNPQIITINTITQLQPLEAKALHVIGTLVQIFDAIGHLLYCIPRQNRPDARYYQYAYLLACTAIELLGRCQSGETHITSSTFQSGLQSVGLSNVAVNVYRNGQLTTYTYDATKLKALRNLLAHGQAVATDRGQSQDVFLSVELLDTFPSQLMDAYDAYYEDLFVSSDPSMRQSLANAAVEPVLYSQQSGNVYVSPIRVAFEQIYEANKKPRDILDNTDWQVYK